MLQATSDDAWWMVEGRVAAIQAALLVGFRAAGLYTETSLDAEEGPGRDRVVV